MTPLALKSPFTRSLAFIAAAISSSSPGLATPPSTPPPSTAAPPHVEYKLRVSPLLLVTTEADFIPFARQVAADVETALQSQPPPTGPRLQLLLGLRVHLAIYFRENAKALAAAAQIRELQTTPAERAHAGLTTRAIVAGNYEPEGFEREFTALLRALPRDPAIRDTLVRARARIAALHAEALLAGVHEKIAPRLARGEPCTIEIADELVRIRHRLKNVLPLRAAMLRAYDAGLATQK